MSDRLNSSRAGLSVGMAILRVQWLFLGLVLIRLSLGKLLLVQPFASGRTDYYPTINLKNGVVGRTMVFVGVMGSNPTTIHNNTLFRLSPCRT